MAYGALREDAGAPLPDVLEECGRQSDRLIHLHDAIYHLGQTQEQLSRIALSFTFGLKPPPPTHVCTPSD